MQRRKKLTPITVILLIGLTLVGVKLFGMTQASASPGTEVSGFSTAGFMALIQTPAGCGASFAQPAGSPAGAGDRPISVAVGDFNLDGKPDLATANYFSDNVTILLGNGSGGFTQPATSPVGAGGRPVSVVVGDFSLDGKPDLAVANESSDDVTILLGNGSGGFTQPAGSPVSAGDASSSVAVGDFNLDGKPDLATANFLSNDVTILLGNGGGGFTQPAGPPVVAGIGPASVAVGDFNLDGKPDLATANTVFDDVTILLGNGMGGFTQPATSPVVAGDHPISVAVGDFNLDGKPDLAVANLRSDNVTILLGNGSGGFTQPAGSPVSAVDGPTFVAVGDFDLDGKPDLATANLFSNDVTILLGNGGGGFTQPAGPPVGAGIGPASVAVGDFNLDGKPDLATANDFSDNVTIQLNTCTANTPPTINAVAVTRTAGAGSSNSQIATVSDARDTENTLMVKVNGDASATINGVTVSNITVDAMGVVKANVEAACGASNASFTLRVTDSEGGFAEATLDVMITTNPAPSLGDYPDTTVTTGGGATITPDSAPSDNVSISNVEVTAPGFTGVATVNFATGVVSISNAGPAGGFPVLIKATDNCGVTTIKSFLLTVAADTCGITINPATAPQPYIAVPYLRILSATPAGNYMFVVSAGQLPPGLRLVTALGVTSIAGLPTTPGAYNFIIKAKKNGTLCEATRSYTVTIPATVVPILECVQRNQNGAYTARFGYDNSTGAIVTIPVGANNYFTPGNQNRGQTTVFQPGRVANAFSVTFTKGSNNNLAVWLLRGPDGVLRPVNVLTTLIGCP